MKKIILLLLMVTGIGLMWTNKMKTEVSSKYSLQDLQLMANNTNKNLPEFIGDSTRFDKIVASQDIMDNQYTLLGVKASEVDMSKVNHQLREMIIGKICVNSQSMKLFKSGVSEWFSYKDEDGVHLSTIKVSSKDCQ